MGSTCQVVGGCPIFAIPLINDEETLILAKMVILNFGICYDYFGLQLESLLSGPLQLVHDILDHGGVGYSTGC